MCGGVSTRVALRDGGAYKHHGARRIETIPRRSACVESSRLMQGRETWRCAQIIIMELISKMESTTYTDADVPKAKSLLARGSRPHLCEP